MSLIIARPVTCPHCDFNVRLHELQSVLEHLEVRLPYGQSPPLLPSTPWPALRSLSLHGIQDTSIVTNVVTVLASQLTNLELGLVRPLQISPLALSNVTRLYYYCSGTDPQVEVAWIAALPNLRDLKWKPPLVESSRLLPLIPRLAHLLVDLEVHTYSLNVKELGATLKACTRLTSITHSALDSYNDYDEISDLWLPHADRLQYLPCTLASTKHFLRFSSRFTALRRLHLVAAPSDEMADLRFPHLTSLTWHMPAFVHSVPELFALLIRLAKVSPALTEMHTMLNIAVWNNAALSSFEQTCVELDRGGNLELLSLISGPKIPPDRQALLKRRVRWLRISAF